MPNFAAKARAKVVKALKDGESAKVISKLMDDYALHCTQQSIRPDTLAVLRKEAGQ